MRNFFLVMLLTFSLVGANANAQELSQLINWQEEWGTIDLNSPNDPGIRAADHLAKSDIKGSAECPNNGDLALLKAYEIDLDGNGLKDILVDPADYFGGKPQGNCPVYICDPAKGCNTPIYHLDSVTNVISGTPAPDKACPATAALNVDCRQECAATIAQCPKNFKYNYSIKFSSRVFAWSFITADAFNTQIRPFRKQGTYFLYRAPLNTNPILRVQRSDEYCTNKEIDVNDDGHIAANEKCIKYMQYVTSNTLCSGGSATCLLDMFQAPPLNTGAAENDEAYAQGPVADFIANGQVVVQAGTGANARTFYKRGGAAAGRADEMCNEGRCEGVGFKLYAGKAVSTQLNKFVVADNQAAGLELDATEKSILANILSEIRTKGVYCREYVNNNPQTYNGTTLTDKLAVFIPAATYREYLSFLAHTPANVVVRECSRRFTAWSGTTSCSAVAPQCNEVITIAASRKCIRSTSKYGSCGECSGALDPQPLDGAGPKGCDFQASCAGDACPEVHNFCLAADTKITMADGSTKDIVNVKVGDSIKAFDSKDPLKALVDAKVKKVLITGEKTTIALNDLKITDVHKVILKDGKRVEAGKVKIGDEIVTADGKVIVVEKITKNLTPVTVYNLDVEGADGYIAGGLRVLDFPIEE